jgi:hypothetical protein
MRLGRLAGCLRMSLDGPFGTRDVDRRFFLGVCTLLTAS